MFLGRNLQQIKEHPSWEISFNIKKSPFDSFTLVYIRRRLSTFLYIRLDSSSDSSTLVYIRLDPSSDSPTLVYICLHLSTLIYTRLHSSSDSYV